MAAHLLPLSSWLWCGESTEPHEIPARYVLPVRTPVSHNPEDGMTEHLFALCGHPACEHAAHRTLPADAVVEPVRALTLDDLAVLGYEADVTGVAA